MKEIVTATLMGLFVWVANIAPQEEPIALADEPPDTYGQAAMHVRLTAYNPVPEQTNSDPDTTASGARSNPEVIAARSRDLAETLPFGTVIAIEVSPEMGTTCGLQLVEHLVGYRVIADVMHERKREQIDVMFDMADTVRMRESDMNPAAVLGVCNNVAIHVVGEVSIQEIPKTQAELRQVIDRTLVLQ